MPPPSHSSLTSALRERLAADIANWTVLELSEYLKLFPGDESAVARTYLELTSTEHATQDPFAARDPVAPDSSRRLGPFALGEVLGAGGQAIVYEARDTRLENRVVALKVLRSPGAADESTLARFRREAAIATSLQHPAICPVLDVGMDAGQPWIAMARIEGQTLATLLRRCSDAALPPFEQEAWRSALVDAESPEASGESHLQRTVRLFEGYAQAVHAAHGAGIVHRDLKPGNLMLTTGGRPMVLDFGLALGRDDAAAALTMDGDRLGTPAYMAPEQTQNAKAVDPRTDVHALGTTLYECLCGQRPFQAQVAEELARLIRDQEATLLDRRHRAIPRDLALITAKAMAKRPADRYESAAAFALDLANWREHRPIRARGTPLSYRLRLWVRRNPAACIVIVALFVLAVQSRWQFGRERRERAQKEAHLASFTRLASLDRAQALLDEADLDRRQSPDRIPAIEDWIARAEELVARRPQFEADARDLRAQAQPGVASPGGPAQATLARRLDAARRHWSSSSDPDEKALARIEALRALIIESSESSPALEFARTEDRFLHTSLQALLPSLEELQTSHSRGLPAVRTRLRRAHEVQAQQAAISAAWQACLARLGKEDFLAGVALQPISGWLPLGIDARSGREEFVDLATGIAPQRDDAGTWVVAPETGMIFVLVPGGEGQLGLSQEAIRSAGPIAAQANEVPARPIRLAPYLIAKFEVHQALFARVTGRNPSALQLGPEGQTDARFPSGPTHPVENLSWHEALQFARSLGYALPTEAQWEFARRAGSTLPFGHTDSPLELHRFANLRDQSFYRATQTQPDARSDAGWHRLDDGHAGTSPVGQFRPNAFGLHDMAGNVWEWCADPYAWYDATLPPAPGDGFLWPAEGAVPDDAQVAPRPVRGGGWLYPGTPYARCAFRRKLGSEERTQDVGLRPVFLLR